MKLRLISAAALAIAATVIPAFAAPVILNGALTQQRVAGLTNEIAWSTSLAQAQWQARREGKMIFWVHMLGDMKGAT